MFKVLSLICTYIVLFGVIAAPVHAKNEIPPAFRSTDFPLPRFVSLASDKIHVRAGPGTRYPILWVFHKENYPVEIILEYGNWRKIRDHLGEEGWVHLSLVSGRRYAYINTEMPVPLYSSPDADSSRTALLKPGVIARMKACEGAYCRLEASGYTGWIERKFVWGVYDSEELN